MRPSARPSAAVRTSVSYLPTPSGFLFSGGSCSLPPALPLPSMAALSFRRNFNGQFVNNAKHKRRNRGDDNGGAGQEGTD